MRQYVTLKKEHVSPEELSDMKSVCTCLGAEGTEVFMDDICSRSCLLYESEAEKKEWVEQLRQLGVKRVHCSYWAYPTSFLTKNNFTQLVERFGGIEEVRVYYGDLTGNHMYRRWMQEYVIASELGAQSYTFHLIDYAPIDGAWEFTISREDIRQAMVFMMQQFMNLLLESGVMTEDSPQIEIENAGFGLEYGIQTAEDYAFLFEQLYDPYHKVRIGWDVNHLLHAVGFRKEEGKACFFLPEIEKTEKMKQLEEAYEKDASKLALEWISYNLLYPETVKRTGAVQLSDCVMKEEEFFVNGKLREPYYQEISSLASWEEKEDYGVKIVLSKYDSHEILGQGILKGSEIRVLLKEIEKQAPEAVLLHELKNSPDMKAAVRQQEEELAGSCESIDS